ncbi:MAG: sensor domain-containing diguanylate cyclase [Gammaproteobacteria bacterium]|nr:sensor domain-containing diguanylate cyclase [Gammaproteobacteria bacterium]
MTTDRETGRLQAQLRKLRAEANNNEQILRRAQRRELALLEADSLVELFNRLTVGLQDSFGVPEATVLLVDPDHEVRHLVAALSTDPLPTGVMLVDRLDRHAGVLRGLRQAWLGPFESRHGRLFRRSDRLASVAILPLARDKRLMGSINLGSSDRRRFSPDHATDFLDHLGAIASFSLENAVNRARLRRSGFTDMLTGWHNRRYLEVRMDEELSRAQRQSTSVSCLMIDIDHFKPVNDNYGHLAGDEVLHEVATRIATQVRVSDVAARFGGEEFVVVMPGTDSRQAAALAERIRESVSATPIAADREHAISVTVSIGVAVIEPGRQHDLETQGRALIDTADEAMYEAKRSGRDRVVVAQPVSIPNEID